MSKASLHLGKSGEAAAAGFLEKNGYRILCRNYRSRLGEVDIVARDKDTICFIEVKTRTSSVFGFPYEAISRSKQRQIAKAALTYLKANSLLSRKARFDVVSILSSGDELKIDLIKNAFELDSDFTY